MNKYWNWWTGGLALGLVAALAVFLVKPIGVSTQYVITDAIIWDALDDEVIVDGADSKTGYASPNAYLDKSGGKYAKNAANPINYSYVFVLAMILGGFIAARSSGSKLEGEEKFMPAPWRERFGNSRWPRYLAAFGGGFLVLFGSRLAGGCTSGHMISGMLQTSLSGYLFAAGVFAAAIPLALFMYSKRA